MGRCFEKTHMQVIYKGIDITDKIGLCVCEECTKSIREKIDLELKNNKKETNKIQQIKNTTEWLAREINGIKKHLNIKE